MTITTTSTLDDPKTTGDQVTWVPQTIVTNIVTSSLVTKTIPRSTPSPLTTPSSSVLFTPMTTNTPSPTPNNLQQFATTSTQSTTSELLPSATGRKIGSPSDVPNQSNLNSTSVPSTSKSTQVGLAVGIPIAIFSIFFIALGVWYFIRSRKRKAQKEKSMNSQYYNNSNHSDETLTIQKPYPTIFSPGAYLHHQEKQVDEIPERKHGFGDRLSKLFPIRSKEVDKPQDNTFMNRVSVITPVLLKKFNLKKTEEDQNTIKPQVVTLPEKSYGYVPTVKSKLNLPPTISVGSNDSDNTSMDQSLYMVIRSYHKSLSDELDIEVGDKVIILEKHSDGWCKVKILRTAKGYFQQPLTTGMVPRMCLQKI
ncbi:FUS1 Nuclear fusion protein FUS1 [Candida maltosa Xu316]